MKIFTRQWPPNQKDSRRGLTRHYFFQEAMTNIDKQADKGVNAIPKLSNDILWNFKRHHMCNNY